MLQFYLNACSVYILCRLSFPAATSIANVRGYYWGSGSSN